MPGIFWVNFCFLQKKDKKDKITENKI